MYYCFFLKMQKQMTSLYPCSLLLYQLRMVILVSGVQQKITMRGTQMVVLHLKTLFTKINKKLKDEAVLFLISKIPIKKTKNKKTAGRIKNKTELDRVL